MVINSVAEMSLTKPFTTHEEVYGATESHPVEMRELDEEKSTLRSSKHNMTSVHKLPPETISMIFLALAAAYATIPRRSKMYPRCYHWLAVMVVCRRWYEVAVNAPQLWTDIYFRESSWHDSDDFRNRVQRFFDRSGSCPLRVLQRGGLQQLHEDVTERPLPSEILNLFLEE